MTLTVAEYEAYYRITHEEEKISNYLCYATLVDGRFLAHALILLRRAAIRPADYGEWFFAALLLVFRWEDDFKVCEYEMRYYLHHAGQSLQYQVAKQLTWHLFEALGFNASVTSSERQAVWNCLRQYSQGLYFRRILDAERGSEIVVPPPMEPRPTPRTPLPLQTLGVLPPEPRIISTVPEPPPMRWVTYLLHAWKLPIS